MFAESIAPPSVDECDFYHVMDLPQVGVTPGQWDLRGRVDDYLGHVVFQGRRVLEIGPASGFLTFEIERRGGDIVCVDLPDDHAWDLVPQHSQSLSAMAEHKQRHLYRLRNSFWLAHHLTQSKSRVLYRQTQSLPDEIGHFDIGVIAAVLLHSRDPLSVVENVARRSDRVVIVDCLFPELEGAAVSRLVPSEENLVCDTWWHFSTDYLAQFLQLLGFSQIDKTHGTYPHVTAGSIPFFTIVASRGGAPRVKWACPAPRLSDRQRWRGFRRLFR